MKKSFKILLSALTIGVFIFFATASGDSAPSIASIAELSTYIKENNFYQESNLSESGTYSFNGSSFLLTKKDKRTGALRKFDGSFETKSSKYSDKGTEFYYLKLMFNDNSYANEVFLVCDDGKLVEPSNNGVLDKNEDDYGLNIPKWHVSLAPDYYIFDPIDK